MGCPYQEQCGDYKKLRCFFYSGCLRYQGIRKHEIEVLAEHLKRLSGYDKKERHGKGLEEQIDTSGDNGL